MELASTTSLGVRTEEDWERLKLLARQKNDRLGIPAMYLTKRLKDLNDKQIRKVDRVLEGK